MNRNESCCFTGHRPGKLPWGTDERDPRCLALKANLALAVEEAYEKGYRHFMSGMARGSDFYFCDAVLALKQEKPDILLEAAVPCENQTNHWDQADCDRYENLLSLCDLETQVQQHYDRGCMHRRNRYMVDRSGLIIAVYDGMMGGTLYTLNYALKEGLDVVLLDANEGRRIYAAAPEK
ncbi:MAG: SLOG family protein [Oscillospiraceae bacterium]